VIITQEIKDIVRRLDDAGQNDEQRYELHIKLVRALDESCTRNAAFYNHDHAIDSVIGAYPMDEEGYAVSFDPIEDEAAFHEAWTRHGVIVGKQVVPGALRQQTIARIDNLFNALSKGAFDIQDPATYDAVPLDAQGTSLISRGFFELYHDDVMAQMRQSHRAYLHHVLIWGDAKLWTSFDRLGVKLPSAKDEGGKALPLHVDQNPRFDPHFKTLQGVMALEDCPLERGTFRGVPGSRGLFNAYASMGDGLREFVELDPNHDIADTLTQNAQAFPLRGGDLVSWDSRTTHANTENISDKPRFVFYTATGKAAEDNESAVKARMDALRSGGATSTFKVPEALLRASIKPRYTNPDAMAALREKERLDTLGELLYGTRRYANVLAKVTP
jgi:hypothetical protein